MFNVKQGYPIKKGPCFINCDKNSIIKLHIWQNTWEGMRCHNVASFYLIFMYLSPACGRRPRLGDYKTPSVRPSVRSSRFCINLNISFIYKDIFTKFAGNVYGYENLSLQNFSLILKNKMAAIANCMKIIKVL